MNESYRALGARHSSNHDPILASMTLKILATKLAIARRRGRHHNSKKTYGVNKGPSASQGAVCWRRENSNARTWPQGEKETARFLSYTCFTVALRQAAARSTLPSWTCIEVAVAYCRPRPVGFACVMALFSSESLNGRRTIKRGSTGTLIYHVVSIVSSRHVGVQLIGATSSAAACTQD